MEQPKEKGVILIVDDTPANLSLLSTLLTSGGYSVRPAPNGHLALKAAKTDPPDLILLDIKMPEMNGFEVCQHLKADKRLSDIPVLFISALSDTMDKVKAFQSGGLDYITKPFNAEEVMARVKTHLSNRRYQLELNQKNTALEKTLNKLKSTQNKLIHSEKMASIGVLTAGIAHEINNPINYIKASVTALNQDMSDIQKLIQSFNACHEACTHKALKEKIDKLKEEIDYPELLKELPALVRNIISGVNRTEEIISSLRTYARLDEKKKTPAVLNDLMDQVLILLQNRYKKRITIHKAYGSLPAIPVQTGKILQVFSNVIDNAIDALDGFEKKDDPRITITTTIEEKDQTRYAVIQVDDNGSGISDAAREKVFDPFFTTKPVGKGMGLGMSISYGIIKDHNGHITIQNNKDGGTLVTINLPVEKECQ